MTTAAVGKASDRSKKLIAELRMSEILEAGAAVFAEKGFAGARMDDVAARAGLSKATVYAYFRSKDEIFEGVVEDAMARISKATEESVGAASGLDGKLEAFIHARMSFWENKLPLFRVILDLRADLPNRPRTLRWLKVPVLYLTNLLAAAAKESEIPEQDFEAAAWAILDLLRGAHERRLVFRNVTAMTSEHEMTRFLLHGLGYRSE
jgi:AcrR family transcriptional regulator